MCKRPNHSVAASDAGQAGQFRYERLGKEEAIIGEQFDALVEYPVATLNKFKVPEREKSEPLGTLTSMNQR